MRLVLIGKTNILLLALTLALLPIPFLPLRLLDVMYRFGQ